MTDAPVTTTRCPFEPFSAAVQHTTTAAYAQMRVHEPVHKLEGRDVYLITRYDDVMAAVKDVETFSNDFRSPSLALGEGSQDVSAEVAAIKAQGYPQVPTMLTADPPAHDRFRRLAARALTPRRIASWEPEIGRIVEELIDGFVSEGEVEFSAAFAVPLPARVIAHALSLPPERWPDFKRWTDHATSAIGAEPGDEARVASARGLVEFQQYFAAQLEERRTDPRDDFLTDLLHAEVLDDEIEDEIEDKRPLEMAEMLSILHQLVVAGSETTAALLGGAMIELGAKPELRREVARDRRVAGEVFDESVRLWAPAQGMFRIVKRPVTVAGVAIPVGATAILMYASANRDETHFPDPDGFVLGRTERHLSFGHGTHYCLGARLSRAESELALMSLCRRLGDFEVVGEPVWKPSFVLSGPAAVTVRFSGP